MSVSANQKCKFAELKYEQLLSDKYFVETCFSKKYESYASKQKLIDILFGIKSVSSFKHPYTTEVEVIECTTTSTTTSTSTSTSTSTTTSSTTTTTTTP